MDLNNLIKFFKLRIHDGAQWEAQQYAMAIKTLITPIVPNVISLITPE
jgi:thymidylate synthase ThyX